MFGSSKEVISEEQQLQIQKTLQAEGIEKDLFTISLFSQTHGSDVEKLLGLLRADHEWKQNLRVKDLKIDAVFPTLQEGKLVYLEGVLTKDGHPVALYRPRLHDPNKKYIDTFLLAVYLIETALQQIPEGKLVLINDLSGFSKTNADVRLIKFFLNLLQSHYPGRLVKFYSVNAPWFYEVLWKVVRPFLPSEISSAVEISSKGVEQLASLYDEDVLHKIPQEFGGLSGPYDVDAFIQSRALAEGVAPLPKLPNPFSLSFDLEEVALDMSVEEAEVGCKKKGQARKQGNITPTWADRYLVLRSKFLIYYRSAKDTEAEGVVFLKGAQVSQKDGEDKKHFRILTNSGRECLFSTKDANSTKEWIATLKEHIATL